MHSRRNSISANPYIMLLMLNTQHLASCRQQRPEAHTHSPSSVPSCDAAQTVVAQHDHLVSVCARLGWQDGSRELHHESRPYSVWMLRQQARWQKPRRQLLQHTAMPAETCSRTSGLSKMLWTNRGRRWRLTGENRIETDKFERSSWSTHAFLWLKPTYRGPELGGLTADPLPLFLLPLL